MPPPPLIALRGAAIGFGGRPTVMDASFSVARGECVCLVGRNGSGKSSLLKALAGLLELDRGERFVQPGSHVAYMAQEPVFDPAMTAASYVSLGLPPGEEPERQRFRVDAALGEVGIDPDRVLVGLSGGEGRRISLARVFVGDPDVLLLDEPTNHLDIPAIEWLEARLAAYSGAVLMISHDRAFLTRLARRVLWLDRGTIHALDKGYAAFEAWSDGILAAEAAEESRLDKKLAAETIWLRQGISARRTRNMGRVRALQDLRRQRMQRVALGTARLTGPDSQSGGRLVVECEGVAKTFPAADGSDRIILRDFSTRVMRGDRVGIVGPNGAGKSTLLKILLGEIQPDGGRIRHGTNLLPARFEQDRAGLVETASVRDNLTGGGGDTVFVQGKPRHVMSYMKDFLFDERQARQPAASLSGGERNRLLLAKVLAVPSNVLVLDEPTNDLDIETLDLLEDLLADYDGTLFLVSHDRDFLDRLVTSVIAVEGGGNVAEYVGGYTDYLRQRQAPQASKPATKRDSQSLPARTERARPPKLGFREQHDLQKLPAMIEALGIERRRLNDTLADGGLYARDRPAYDRASRRLANLEAELAAAEDRWLELELKRAEFDG